MACVKAAESIAAPHRFTDRLIQVLTLWVGGWGSNPRPADDENYGTHRHQEFLRFLTLGRSAHRSVTELETDIRNWITEWNKNPRRFVRTKSPDEIFENLAAYCQLIIDSAR